MRGLKLFGISALAANKDALKSRMNGVSSVGQPLTVEEPRFGRRQALQSILLGTAAVAVVTDFAVVVADPFVGVRTCGA